MTADKKPLLPRGPVKFKLVPMERQYKDPTTGIETTHTCPELINPPCEDCRETGQIEVAYGKRQGIYDVYRFLCKCKFPQGKDRQALVWAQNYTGRPVAYQVKEDEVPRHVLIHPIHAKSKMAKLRQHLRRTAEELGKDVEDLPF